MKGSPVLHFTTLYKADQYLLEWTTLGKCLAKSPISLSHQVLHTTRGKPGSVDVKGKQPGKGVLSGVGKMDQKLRPGFSQSSASRVCK